MPTSMSMASSSWRWLVLMMTLLPVAWAMVPAPILGADHIDGATTFCYDDHDLIARLSSAAKFPWHGADCPIELSVQALCSPSCQAKQALSFTLTATTQFARPNAFNLPRLEATTKNALNHSVQTNMAVVYGCDNDAICDLVDNATTATPTFTGDDGSGNFTNGKASFTQSIEFASAGSKVVVGYLELPPSVSTHNQTLHFVVFAPLQVAPAADNEEALVPTKKKESSGSNGLLFGIIGGIVAVLLGAGVAFFIVRKRQAPKEENEEHATLTGKATTEVPPGNFDGSGASTLPANSLAREFPVGAEPVVSPHSRDAFDDMTFQLPEERFSMDSEGSMGTGQTLAYVGMAATPTTLPVPKPHGAKYEVLDGSAYYAPPIPVEDSSAGGNDTVVLPSVGSNLDSQQSYGIDDDSGVEDDGHSMSTIELPSPSPQTNV